MYFHDIFIHRNVFSRNDFHRDVLKPKISLALNVYVQDIVEHILFC